MKNRKRKQNLNRVKSKQSEYELWFKSLIVEQYLKSRISNLKDIISECNKQSDKELFSKSLKKAEYAKKASRRVSRILKSSWILVSINYRSISRRC